MRMNLISFNETESNIMEFLDALYSLGIPIALKGAIATRINTIMLNNRRYFRETKDLDFCVMNNLMNEQYILNIFQRACDILEKGWKASVSRKHTVKSTLGIQITLDSKIIFNSDIEMNTTVLGINAVQKEKLTYLVVCLDNILVDKLYALSTDLCYKNRFKDLIDVFIISSTYNINYLRFMEYFNISGKELSDFSGFSDISNFKNVWRKFRGLIGFDGITFETIWNRLNIFIQPFKNKYNSNLIWDSNKGIWRHTK